MGSNTGPWTAESILLYAGPCSQNIKFKAHVPFDARDSQAWENVSMVILFLEVLGLSLLQPSKIIS